jgi:hypothetical protein
MSDTNEPNAPESAENEKKQETPGEPSRVSVPELDNPDTMMEALGMSIPAQVESVEGFDFEGFEPVEEKSAGGEVDEDGETFDPEKHRADKDGNPVKTAKGRWAKKPGRGSRVGKSKKSEETSADPESKARAVCKAHAIENVSLMYAAGGFVLGEDGLPTFSGAPKGEADELVAGWENYYWSVYVETGELPKRPPLVAVAALSAAYVSRRLTGSEKSRSRVAIGLKKIGEAFGVFKRRALVPLINRWKERNKKKAG